MNKTKEEKDGFKMGIITMFFATIGMALVRVDGYGFPMVIGLFLMALSISNMWAYITK